MNNTELSLDTLIERMEPYDYHKKEDFIKLLEEIPELKESLELLLKNNEKWVQKAATGEVQFIVYDTRWKTSAVHRKEPYVILNFIKGTPVVSLNV